MNLFIEVVSVGLILILMCKIVIYGLGISENSHSLLLFITGVLTHLFFEIVGVHRWYCTNGYACSR